MIKELRRLFHVCSSGTTESMYVHHYNSSLDAIPNPLSTYGPIGSYQGQLFHCKVCGKYWGRKYDTYGKHDLDFQEAQRMWLGGV